MGARLIGRRQHQKKEVREIAVESLKIYTGRRYADSYGQALNRIGFGMGHGDAVFQAGAALGFAGQNSIIGCFKLLYMARLM